MISSGQFRLTLALVRRADVCDAIECQLRTAPQGRKRGLTVEVLLTGMSLAFLKYGQQRIRTVHQVLTQDLSRTLRAEFGLTGLTERQVGYLWNRVVDLYEYSERKRPDLDIVERARRKSAFEEVSDKITGATGVKLGNTGRWAVDESGIDSAARGKRRPRGEKQGNGEEGSTLHRRSCSADLDADWGYRTRTEDNRTSWVFGYQAVGFTRVGVGSADEPLLLERVRLVPANEKGLRETIDVIDALKDDGAPVREIFADRGFSYGNVDSWARPLADRDIEQVMDIHPNDHGATTHTKHGYLMVDGWPHCPSMPDELKVIDRPTRFSVPEPTKARGKSRPRPEDIATYTKHKRELDRFQEKIEERRQYRFEKNGKTPAGAQRYICPARAGKVVCAQCPLSQLQPDAADKPNVTPPQGENLPRACTNETMSVKSDVGLKLRQRLYWGSPEWIREYSPYPRRRVLRQDEALLEVRRPPRMDSPGWARQDRAGPRPRRGNRQPPATAGVVTANGKHR